MEILRTLEAHYGDMQDTEFTVEEGRLYMLQTRNAKRPAQAAVRFAVDAVDEGLLDRERGADDDRRRASSTRCCTRRSTRNADYEVLATRRRRLARRGQGRGRLHRRRRRSRPPPRARDVDARAARSPRPTTSPASTPPRASSRAEGGKASPRRARRARHGRPVRHRRRRAGDRPRGARIARRRHDAPRRATSSPSTAPTGEVTLDDVPLVEPEDRRRRDPQAFETVLGWADELRRLGVRANADTPRGRRARRASSAPRASACAAPSTCSWPRTASRRCGR